MVLKLKMGEGVFLLILTGAFSNKKGPAENDGPFCGFRCC